MRRQSTWIVVLVLLGSLGGCGGGPQAPAPAGPVELALRAEMLLVTPATGPLTHVLVCNCSGREFAGVLEVDYPTGWKLNKTAQPVQVGGGQTVRVPFAIEKGLNSPDNSYRVQMRVLPAAGQPPVAKRDQGIVCASAPYLSIQVDARTDDWKGAIPVTWRTYGRSTVVRTAWTKRTFSVLVAVEEDKHETRANAKDQPYLDAVQIAIAPRDARLPAKAGDPAGRHELLLMAEPDGPKCLVLARTDQAVRGAADALNNPVDPLRLETMPEAKLAIWREKETTFYELSVPVKQLAPIEPEPGREFCFSVLVHDGDKLTRRDWGVGAGLWPIQRLRMAWTPWKGGCWTQTPPFDSRIEWGFCSSAQ